MVNNITYKGFDFSIFLYASAGAMLNNNIEYLNKPGRANSIIIDYWTPDNPTNAYPRPSVDNASPAYVKSLQYEKADFLRVRNITLGYTLPEKLLKKYMPVKYVYTFPLIILLLLQDFPVSTLKEQEDILRQVPQHGWEA